MLSLSSISNLKSYVGKGSVVITSQISGIVVLCSLISIFYIHYLDHKVKSPIWDLFLVFIT